MDMLQARLWLVVLGIIHIYMPALIHCGGNRCFPVVTPECLDEQHDNENGIPPEDRHGEPPGFKQGAQPPENSHGGPPIEDSYDLQPQDDLEDMYDVQPPGDRHGVPPSEDVYDVYPDNHGVPPSEDNYNVQPPEDYNGGPPMEEQLPEDMPPFEDVNNIQPPPSGDLQPSDDQYTDRRCIRVRFQENFVNPPNYPDYFEQPNIGMTGDDDRTIYGTPVHMPGAAFSSAYQPVPSHMLKRYQKRRTIGKRNLRKKKINLRHKKIKKSRRKSKLRKRPRG